MTIFTIVNLKETVFVW